jgi:hypothetical protein
MLGGRLLPTQVCRVELGKRLPLDLHLDLSFRLDVHDRRLRHTIVQPQERILPSRRFLEVRSEGKDQPDGDVLPQELTHPRHLVPSHLRFAGYRERGLVQRVAERISTVS